MPTLSISLTVRQAQRIETALRQNFNADPTKTVAQLAQSYVMAMLKDLVLKSEDADRRKLVESQLPVLEDFEQKPV